MSYKVGDTLQLVNDCCDSMPEFKKGTIVTIIDIDNDPEEEFPFYIKGKNSDGNEDSCWVAENHLAAIAEGKRGRPSTKPRPVNFLLKYDLDEDPIEEFETMAEVKERIDYLVQHERSLKRDSIVVYTIKKKQRVTVRTNIFLHA